MVIKGEIVKSSPNSYLVDIEIHGTIVQDRDKGAKPKGIFLNTSAVYHIGHKGNKQTGTQQTRKTKNHYNSCHGYVFFFRLLSKVLNVSISVGFEFLCMIFALSLPEVGN